MTFTLSPSQQRAVDGGVDRLTRSIDSTDHRDYETRLTGAAGTGKTASMLALLDALDSEPGTTLLMAPTWRAARQLEASTGRPATSIHKAIFAPPKQGENGQLQFNRLTVPHGSIRRAVIDEASMVGTKLVDGDQYVGGLRRWALRKDPKYASWRDHQNRVRLFILGDKEQLTPVQDTWGFDLDNAEFNLTEVFRQALESPGLDLATQIRERRFAGWGAFTRWTNKGASDEHGRCECFGSGTNSAGLSGVEKLVAKVLEGASDTKDEGGETGAESNEGEATGMDSGAQTGVDAVIICWTNNERQSVNTVWRSRLGLPMTEIVAGERLLSFSNFSGVCNGDLLNVSAVSAPFIASYQSLGLKRPRDKQGNPSGAGALVNGIPCVAVRIPGFTTIGELLEGKRARVGESDEWDDDFADELVRTDEQRSTITPDSLGSALLASISDFTHFLHVDSTRYPVPRRLEGRTAFFVAREIPLIDAEFGYGVTCHKMQGSQAQRVGVCVPNRMADPDEFRRWLYTALTRTRRDLFLLVQ